MKNNFKFEVIKAEAKREYHDLSRINESNNPELSLKVKKEIIQLVRNSNLSIADSLNCLKNTLLHLSFIAFDGYINDLENNEIEKMQEDMK